MMLPYTARLAARPALSAAARATAAASTRLLTSSARACAGADALHLDAHAYARWRDGLDAATMDTLAGLLPGGAGAAGESGASVGAYVGGEWVGASDGATFDVLDPATGEHLAALPDATADDARAAVDAAHAAGAGWAAATAKPVVQWRDVACS